jgi:hypothetical protein
MSRLPYLRPPIAGVSMITSTPGNGLGLAALVLAVLGFVSGWVPRTLIFTVLFGGVAVLFGVLGCVRVSRGLATNTAVTVAGLALGAGVAVLGVWAMHG